MDYPKISPQLNRFRAKRCLLGLLFLFSGLTLLGAQGLSSVQAQESAGQPEILLADISGTIDLGLAPYLERVLADAESQGAPAVILELNTPGGRLDAVLQMRQSILDSPVRTIAYVNREAFSAGALIAIAANEIYMAPGAVMGAATPVEGTGETASEKVVSAVRSTFGSTAEHRGRDPRIAEAMVDPSIAIEGLVEEGKLLTLTTTQAIEWDYAEGVAASREELLEATGLTGTPIREVSTALAERLVRFLTDPIVASLLTSIGFILILVDIYSGGIGALTAAGVGMFGLFFWGHFLAGLAGWESIALVILGLALIGVEIFVIPGFGIPGLLGIASLLGGVYLSVVGQEIVTGQDVERALTTVGLTFVFIVIGTVLILWLLPRATRFRGLVLQAQVGQVEAPAQRTKRRRWFRAPAPPELFPTTVERDQRPEDRPSLTGAKGQALTQLRPGGIAMIDGERVDVVTQGDFVPPGTAIEVIQDDRYRTVVRRINPDTPAAGSGSASGYGGPDGSPA